MYWADTVRLVRLGLAWPGLAWFDWAWLGLAWPSYGDVNMYFDLGKMSPTCIHIFIFKIRFDVQALLVRHLKSQTARTVFNDQFSHY